MTATIHNIKLVSPDGTIEYKHAKKPKATTYGNSAFGTLSAGGFAYFQNELGLAVLDDKSYCDFIKAAVDHYALTKLNKAVQIPRELLGTRGPSWKTSSEREDYQVFVNGEAFNPPIKEKYEQLEAEKNAAKATATVETVVEAPQSVAVADTSKPDVLAIIKKAKEAGHDDTAILNAMTKKYGEEQTKMYMKAYSDSIAPKEIDLFAETPKPVAQATPVAQTSGLISSF